MSSYFNLSFCESCTGAPHKYHIFAQLPGVGPTAPHTVPAGFWLDCPRAAGSRAWVSFHFIFFFWPNFPWVQASTATWVDSPRRTQVMPPSSQLVVTMVGTAACIKKGRKEGRKSPKL